MFSAGFVNLARAQTKTFLGGWIFDFLFTSIHFKIRFPITKMHFTKKNMNEFLASSYSLASMFVL